MGIFSKLFGRKEPEKLATDVASTNSQVTTSTQDTSWEEVPAFSDAKLPKEEEKLVTLIATAIAANDQPDSRFKIVSIRKRNPEAKTVALISSAIAAGALGDCQFSIKRISRKK
ncbi:MAG: hypothetical protein LBM95_02840 [Lactobacillales bacterium]|jgi:hypothetical protein|nr:hypothetical protein [Lactobacillales bacterium]